MKRSAVTNVAFAVALVGALASLSGCAAHSAYVVTAVHEEKIDGRLDAQWFQRSIYDAKGGLSAVELVYCPIVPKADTVCRTAIVYQYATSELIKQ